LPRHNGRTRTSIEAAAIERGQAAYQARRAQLQNGNTRFAAPQERMRSGIFRFMRIPFNLNTPSKVARFVWTVSRRFTDELFRCSCRARDWP
jgi:hypothetical protein